MNLEVLKFLLENDYIEENAKVNNVDAKPSIGIAKLILSNNGSLNKLSENQMYHFNTVIKPLMENVQCEGPIGMIEDENGNTVSSCVNDGIIDDESLIQSYLEGDFKCQLCRFDSNKLHES